MAPPPTPGNARHAARRAAAARQPVRVAARFEPRALGAARTGRRGQIPDLDRRQPAAPGRLPRATRGQAGGGGPPPGAIPESSRTRAPGSPVKTAPVRLTGGAALPAGLHFTAGRTIARACEPWRGAPSLDPSARIITHSLC